MCVISGMNFENEVQNLQIILKVFLKSWEKIKRHKAIMSFVLLKFRDQNLVNKKNNLIVKNLNYLLIC